MMIEPEQKIIASQFKILSAEKRPMFSNIWNQFKASMGEVKTLKLICFYIKPIEIE